jgi:hypothetical protein
MVREKRLRRWIQKDPSRSFLLSVPHNSINLTSNIKVSYHISDSMLLKHGTYLYGHIKYEVIDIKTCLLSIALFITHLFNKKQTYFLKCTLCNLLLLYIIRTLRNLLL